MSDSVQSLLESFDRLSPAEMLIAAREIGKRVKHRVSAQEQAGLDPDELTSIADQLFQMYDREESLNGPSESASW